MFRCGLAGRTCTGGEVFPGTFARRSGRLCAVLWDVRCRFVGRAMHARTHAGARRRTPVCVLTDDRACAHRRRSHLPPLAHPPGRVGSSLLGRKAPRCLVLRALGLPEWMLHAIKGRVVVGMWMEGGMGQLGAGAH